MSAALVCPYCKSQLLPQMKTERCDRCSAVYHADCWKDYGRCSVFGCMGQRERATAQALLFIPAILWLVSQLYDGVAAAFSYLLLPAIAYCWIATIYYMKHLYADIRYGRAALARLRHDFLFLLMNAIPIVRATMLR